MFEASVKKCALLDSYCYLGIEFSSDGSCDKHPRQTLGYKTNQKSPCKRECEEFEIALQHKTKLSVYRELKHQVGFEEHLA